MKLVTRSLLAGTIVSAQAQPVFADELPPVYVLVPPDNAGDAECNLTGSTSSATAEAALRYNRVPVATLADYQADRSIGLEIDVDSYEIRRSNDTRTGTCAISLRVWLGTYGSTFDPVHKNVKRATIQYCAKSTLATIDKLTAQSTIDAKITEFTNLCLSEYAKIK